MNIKDTINFKALREKGPSSINVENNEVVQLITKGSEIKVIVTQDHYLNLLNAYHQLLLRSNVKKEETVNIEERMQSFEEKLAKVMQLAEEDDQRNH